MLSAYVRHPCGLDLIPLLTRILNVGAVLGDSSTARGDHNLAADAEAGRALKYKCIELQDCKARQQAGHSLQVTQEWSLAFIEL